MRAHRLYCLKETKGQFIKKKPAQHKLLRAGELAESQLTERT